MLDYAANAVVYWPAGTIAQTFAQICEELGDDPQERLQKFLGDEREPDGFWQKVDDNFQAGRLKLIFVADQIPRELARIVEFLNEQMTAEVIAVELRYFEGEGGFRTLVPRIIGATERANAKKLAINRQKAASLSEWIEARIAVRGDVVLRSFDHVRRLAEEVGAELSLAETQGSVSVIIRNSVQQQTRPLSLNASGTITINLGYAKKWMSGEMRRNFYERFGRAVGPLSNQNPDGYPSFPVERLSRSENVQAFEKVARDWIDAFENS